MRALWQAARVGIIVTYVGRLCLILAALSSVPLAVALVCGEMDVAVRYLIVVAVYAAIGLASRTFAEVRLQRNEGMIIAGLGFVVGSLGAVYPLMGAGLPFLDALFEAVSGVTTTGLSTVSSLEDKPATMLFARAWLQWCGGLGVVILALALFQDSGAVAKDLAVTESTAENLLGSTKAYARRVVIVYAALTAIGVAMLAAVGLDFAEAVELAMAAISTGGFAPRDDSLASLSGVARYAVTAVCLAGAIPLLLYYQIHLRRQRRREGELETVILVVSIVVVAVAVILAMRLAGASWGEALEHGPVLAASAQTTAGFASLDLGGIDDGSKLVSILAMSVGGCAGSTAGGVKIVRLLVVIRMVQLVVSRAALPKHAVANPELAGRKLELRDLRDALVILCLFPAVVLLSWLAFLAAGYDAMDSLFEVASATGTAGLSTGVTSADLPAFLKLVLCCDMLLGRLEFIVWVVALSPRTWFGRRVKPGAG